jgi:hypothetical protein
MIQLIKKDRNKFAEGTPSAYYHNKKVPLVSVQRVGKVYQVADKQVELFKIGVLAEAMDRAVVTVRELERDKKIPPPLFDLGNNKRHYSGTQIVNINRLIFLRWKGQKFFQNTEVFEKYCEEIRSVWYASTIVINDQGEFDAPAHDRQD